jgi:branched-chain amino acid transport system permease protein
MSGVLDKLGNNKNFVIAVGCLAFAAVLPLFFDPLSNITDNFITAGAYVVMALGLNIVVGFAGLLDLGYVAFYAIGAYATGWFASDHFSSINGEKGIHIGAGEFASNLPGIHLNFLLILVVAVVIVGIAGMLIGLPTLRLRGDYI